MVTLRLDYYIQCEKIQLQPQNSIQSKQSSKTSICLYFLNNSKIWRSVLMQENTDWHNHFSSFVGYTKVNWYSNIHHSLSGFRVQCLFSLNSHWISQQWQLFSQVQKSRERIPGIWKSVFRSVRYRYTIYEHNLNEQLFIVVFLSLLSWLNNYNDYFQIQFCRSTRTRYIEYMNLIFFAASLAGNDEINWWKIRIHWR